MTKLYFDGVTKDYVTVLSKGRPYWAPFNREIQVLPNGRKRLVRTEKEAMTIPVEILIDGNSKEDLLEKAEEIGLWLVTKDEKRLQFSDEMNRSYIALLDGGVDVDEVVSFSRCTVDFLVLDKVGAEKTINVTTSNTTHTVTGQDNSPWTIEAVFSRNTTIFELETNQELYILLGYEFIEGDRLTIRYEGREVWINGININYTIRLASNYDLLRPGSLQIKASHDCTLKYNESYF
ncbi:Phage tail protein [Oceanobacillus oncorhynchi]|uniref:Phage tail protein n=1 Tax=Oceanobacillus oncorhynchi TaxID=545501 RepID=A0A0A1MNW6_9BACI|nr:distal tail protein Dit [Oceanobacillus oncorhynchi]CEI81312.1 Phage tail protein [Oceanobacillus oncorhynchi]